MALDGHVVDTRYIGEKLKSVSKDIDTDAKVRSCLGGALPCRRGLAQFNWGDTGHVLP